METEQARQLLGLGREFDLAAIDRAFRAKAQIHHPDRGGDPEAMKAAVAARTQLIESLNFPPTERISGPSVGPPTAEPAAPMDRVSFTTVSVVLLIPVAVMVALVVITLVVVSSVQ